MTARTRIGFVTLIILGGCILAIPHFRHPIGTAKADSKDETQISEPSSDLTLKVELSDPEHEVVAQPPAPQRLRETVSLERHSIIVQTPDLPVPASVDREEWKFPPVSEPPDPDPNFMAKASGGFEPSSTSSPAPSHTSLGTPRPQPIRLLAEGIGRQAPAHTPEPHAPPEAPSQVTPRSEATPETTRFTAAHASGAGTTHRAETPAVDDSDSTALHRVVNGDTLENLAQQYYGDPRKAMLIYESNRDALFHPAILPLGLDLKIPPAVR